MAYEDTASDPLDDQAQEVTDKIVEGMTTLAPGVGYPYIFYNVDSERVDINGYFLSPGPGFGSSADVDTYVEHLEDTEVGIIKERYYDEDTESIAKTYYTVSETSSPTIRINDDDEYTVRYRSDEKTALQSKYGSPSELTTEEIIQSKFSSLTADAAATTLNVEYLFNKIKYPKFRENVLSSFETQESIQPTTTTTTYVSEATTSDSGY
jgi:hypothetical protein